MGEVIKQLGIFKESLGESGLIRQENEEQVPLLRGQSDIEMISST